MMTCRIVATMVALGLVGQAFQPAVNGQEGKPDPSNAVKDRLETLIKALDTRDDEKRWQALLSLAELGPAAAPATAHMIELLRSQNLDVRLASCLALGKVGKEAVPPLIKMLDDKDAEVRALACWSLGLNGAAARSAINALLRVRDPQHREVYRRATIALGRIGEEPQKVVPVLLEGLFNIEDPVHAEMPEVIGNYGAKAVPYLEKKLPKGSREQRFLVIACLERIGEPGWPVLKRALDSDDMIVRHQAIAALDRADSTHPFVLGALMLALENRDYETTVAAHLALNRRGPPAASAVPTLVKVMFTDPFNHIRSLETLQALGHDPREDVRQRLKAKDKRTRALAGYWLMVHLGEKEQGLKEMQEGLDVAEGELLRELAKALAQRGIKDKVIPILARALKKEKDQEECFRILQALCPLAEKEDEAIHAIAIALGDPAPIIRFDAARFLGGLGPRAAIALPALRAAQDDPDKRARDMVRQTIGRLEKK